MAFVFWRPAGPGYAPKKPCAQNLLKIPATGDERGPVRAEGDDGSEKLFGEGKKADEKLRWICTSLITTSNIIFFLFPFRVF